MDFIVTHRYGDEERALSTEALPLLLRELDDRPEDTEHGDVSVTNESNWCRSVSRGGYVAFENWRMGTPGTCGM